MYRHVLQFRPPFWLPKSRGSCSTEIVLSHIIFLWHNIVICGCISIYMPCCWFSGTVPCWPSQTEVIERTDCAVWWFHIRRWHYIIVGNPRLIWPAILSVGRLHMLTSVTSVRWPDSPHLIGWCLQMLVPRLLGFRRSGGRRSTIGRLIAWLLTSLKYIKK